MNSNADLVTMRSATPKLRQVLDSFVSRSVLFSLLYFIVTSVYRRSYWRYFGINPSTIDVSKEIVLGVDVFLFLYTFALGALLIGLPERWWLRIAALFRLDTYRNGRTAAYRAIGLFVIGALYLIAQYMEAHWNDSLPDFGFFALAPASAQLSSKTLLLMCVVVILAAAGLYRVFRSPNQLGLYRLHRVFKGWAIVVYEAGIPLIVAVVLLGGIAFPDFIGSVKALIDIRALHGTNSGLVAQITARFNTCLPINAIGVPETNLYYVGEHSGQDVFLIVPPYNPTKLGWLQPPEFHLCLVEPSVLSAVYLSQEESK